MIFIKYDTDIIKNAVGECGDITVLATVDSTNTYAKERCRHNIADRSIIIACEQTAGRGRRGKSFFSPNDGGVYMSIVLKSDLLKSQDAQLLTVYTAVSVRRALDKICNIQTGIKWVNDIFYDSRKICGILCEAVTNSDNLSVSHYIVGVGINIGHNEFPEEIQDIAGSVFCKPGDENLIVTEISRQLFGILSNSNTEDIISEYKSGLMMLNKMIEFIKDGELSTGIAVDINEYGNLIVRCGEQYVTLISGEISLGSHNFTKNKGHV